MQKQSDASMSYGLLKRSGAGTKSEVVRLKQSPVKRRFREYAMRFPDEL